jgi:hypothetical protein
MGGPRQCHDNAVSTADNTVSLADSTVSVARRRVAPVAVIAMVVLVALASVGCGGNSESRDAPLPTLEVVPMARIAGTSVGEAGFGRIADLEIGHDGTIYVLDGLNRVVHAFDERGLLRATFGGRGRGPGELEEPTALLWGPGGTLWIVDAGNARYAVYDPAGALVRTVRSDDPFVFYPLAAAFSDAGRLYTVTLEFGRLEQPNALLVEAEVGDGEARPIRRVALPFPPWPDPFEHSAGGQMLVLPVPFAPEPAFRIDGRGRLWYASGADPWVQRWSPDRGTEQRYGREFDPPPVSSAERAAALDGPDVQELRAAAGAAGIAELSGRIPTRKPHLRGFFLDEVGNVWIMPAVGGAGTTASPIEIYRPDGTPTGAAHLQLEADPRPRVRGGILVGVVRDELAVESVVLYRIANPR